MLTFTNVSHSFANHQLFSALDIELSAPRIQLTGANGSGKTTFLLLAAGLLAPTSGQVLFKQQPVLHHHTKQRIGISAAKILLPEFMSAQELLNFHCHMHGCRLDGTLVEQLALTAFLHTKIADLSLGNCKKLSLLTALLHQPQLLLLDEPFNGLDDASRRTVLQLLDEYPAQVMLASHEPLPLKNQPLALLTIEQLKRSHA